MQAGGTAAPPPPPGIWMDASRPTLPATGDSQRIDINEASYAWKHCKNVARDDGRTPDLYDLLSHSVRESQYSFPPQGWPTQVRMLTPIVNEMPAMVTDRYNACQTVAFCGIFPEIRRAWASVDNSLFLWRYDKWQDVPIEYSGEEQSIVSVGLCTPKPRVFIEAIRHILVICTTTEIVLLGVCCSDDSSEEITLQPLPLYSVPSDDVAMTSVSCTPEGRIFVGGADGHLYEVKYAAADSWRSKRCTKVCHTGGIRQYLPSFLPGFLFGAPQALVDIVIDTHRNILYTRTQTSAIQVYDLGTNAEDAPKKVAEIAEFLPEAARALGGREVFGRGIGDKKGAAVVYMACIPPRESRRLHLLTVTADGRRVYWSAASSRSSSNPAGPRPDRLRAEVARQAMPSPSAAARAAGSVSAGVSHHIPTRGLEVVAAGYGGGSLLLAESTPGEARTRVFLLSRDLTIPPVGTATGAHVAVAGLRESIAELDVVLPGEACTIKSIPYRSSQGGIGSLLLSPTTLGSDGKVLAATTETTIRDELTTQNEAPPPRFSVVTTAGIAQIERLRPADILAQLLQEQGGNKLELFFKSYAPPEAAAMCIQLASATGLAPSIVIANAKAALDNPALCGEPQLRDDGNGVFNTEIQSEEPAAYLSGGFDMGAVVPVAEPEWSAAHKGLCLYVSRLLQPAWDQQIVAPIRSSSSLLRCTLSIEALGALEDKLRALEAFLTDYLSRKHQRRFGALSTAAMAGHDFLSMGQPASKRQRLEDAHRLELKRTQGIKALVARAADACFLLRTLVEHNLSRLTARLEDSARSALKPLRFRDWVAEEVGESVASQLIAVLVSEHLGAAGGLAEDLAAALQQGCPSYFHEADKIYYNASGILRKAEAAAVVADRQSLTKEAVSLMLRVPLACDLGQIIPQLAALRAFDAVVELSVRKAAALDPGNVALLPGPEGQTARVKRNEACYSHVATILRILTDTTSKWSTTSSWTVPPMLEPFKKSITTEERPVLRQQLLSQVSATSDGLLHEALYAVLVDTGSMREILALDTPFLEPYLVQSSGLSGATTDSTIGPLSPSQVAHADVLARLYIGRREYAAAAGVYELLASRAPGVTESPDPTLDTRISHLQAAVLQARSFGDLTLVDRLEVKVKVAQIQANLVGILSELLRNHPPNNDGESWDSLGLELTRNDMEALVADVCRALYSLEDLYNDVARPAHTWYQCLELLDVSSVSDPPYMRQLWDLLIKDEWTKGWNNITNGSTATDGPDGASDEKRAIMALQSMCDTVSTLGERFYPNDSSFPAASILLRLEQAATGVWPVATGIVLDSSRSSSSPVWSAMVTACGHSYETVVKLYETLLSAGSETGLDARRLLESIQHVIAAGIEKAIEKAPVTSGYSTMRSMRRELSVLAAACEAFGGEARRRGLGDQAEAFAQLSTRIQELTMKGGQLLTSGVGLYG